MSKNLKQTTMTHHVSGQGKSGTSADPQPLTNITIKTRKHALFDKETRKSIDEAISIKEPDQSKPKTPVANSSNILKASANKLYQDAKLNLEQSGNLKTSIKEQVMHSLTGMYEIILQLYESQSTLQLQMEKENTESRKEMLRKELEHAGRVEALASTIKEMDWRSPVGEILKEVKSLKQALHSTTLHPSIELDSTGSGKLVTDPLLQEIRDVSGRITEVKSEVQGNAKLIKESIVTVTTAISSIKTMATYAEKVAGYTLPPTTILTQAPTHSIIVTSENDADTSDEVINKIRGAVEAKSSGIKVDRIRKAKDQKVIVSCREKEEITRIMEKLKTSHTNLRVEETKNKDPLVIIRDVLSYNTDDDIIASLKSQNSNILGDIKNEDFRATVKYRRRARNPQENHVVLQVSPQIWQRLTAERKIHIDLQRVSVLDQSPLVQCTKCLGYGHGRKLCRESIEVCSHCAGPHLRADCPSYLMGDVPTCRNCQSAKYEKTDHHSFNADCPIRKKWDTIARTSVAYC